MHALAQALKEFSDAGGWPARHRLYADLAGAVRKGLLKLGVEPLLPAEETSVVLSAYRVPSALDYDALHDALKARGFIIYAGQGDLRTYAFRVANMGTLTPRDMTGVVRAFAAAFSELGVPARAL